MTMFLRSSILMSLCLMVIAGGAAAQTEGRVPGGTLGASSDSDMWRAVRRGEGGIVLSPDARPELVLTAPFSDCAKSARCTESAVGFTLPIHDDFPAIRELQGIGTSQEALILIALLLGGGLIGGAIFVRSLGDEAGRETPAEG